jgi:hypothetical protein
MYASPVTPSPGPPRLKKTPAAGHPLPQGGEGGNPDEDERSEHKCRNSRPSSQRGEGNVALAMTFGDQLQGFAARHPMLGAF